MVSLINSHMANPFEQIRANAGDQKRSMDWYQRQVQQLAGNITTPGAALRSDVGEMVGRIEVGSMYMFMYDPKTANLPYYDKFPLVLPYDDARGGFYGLNLHYLPYALRGALLGSLIETKDSVTIGPDTKMRYTWQTLQSASRYPGVKPTVKRYLYNQVRSRLVKVNPEDWRTAIFLPVEQFVGASKQKVFTDSRQAL